MNHLSEKLLSFFLPIIKCICHVILAIALYFHISDWSSNITNTRWYDIVYPWFVCDPFSTSDIFLHTVLIISETTQVLYLSVAIKLIRRYVVFTWGKLFVSKTRHLHHRMGCTPIRVTATVSYIVVIYIKV